jgi:hypothetical protein
LPPPSFAMLLSLPSLLFFNDAMIACGYCS